MSVQETRFVVGIQDPYLHRGPGGVYQNIEDIRPYLLENHDIATFVVSGRPGEGETSQAEVFLGKARDVSWIPGIKTNAVVAQAWNRQRRQQEANIITG